VSHFFGDGRSFRLETDDNGAWRFLAVDGLGHGRLTVNLMQTAAMGNRFHGTGDWSVQASEGAFLIRAKVCGNGENLPLVLVFERTQSSATLLGKFMSESIASAPVTAGIFRDGWDGGGAEIELPGLLHFPDFGSFEISASHSVRVCVRGARQRDGTGTTTLELPAVADGVAIEYLWKVTAPHPRGVPSGRVFDTVRRNFLNALQLNPQFRLLANSTAGGPGPFALYFYSGIATHGVTLARGLTTLDLLRQSIERFFGGFQSYGMAGYQSQIPYDFLDTYPSLLIATADYADPSGDTEWVRRHYPRIREWLEKMLAQDVDGDGLLEYPASGNAGSWPDPLVIRPSNWWDTIGFGHKDAYGNALAAEALRRTANLARMANQPCDADRCLAAVERIREMFVPAFFNPRTGVLGGWRSADGELHDHWFIFVNSLAILFDLVPEDLAHSIMDRMLAKLKEVGFDRFDLGLPGNLVPVPKCDYVHHDLRWGGGACGDNSDGFQIYENGGATVCFAGFTIEALYKLGRVADGDRILFPMLEGFDQGNFQGPCSNGRTKDWRAWDGTCHGYEWLLADGYLTLRAALKRPAEHPLPAE